MATTLSYLIESEGDGEAIQITPEIDLIYEVGVGSTTTITSLPVETGRNINDNAVDDPVRIRLSGAVSNMLVAEGRSPDQPKQTWTLLQDLKARRVLMTLVTELGVYENLLIQSLGNDENRQTGTSLQFKMSLQQVDFVDAEFTEINKETVDSSGPAANRTEKVNKGVLNASAD